MHTLSLSAPSRYLSLRSEVIVAVLRSFTQPSAPRPVTSIQKLGLKDPGVKGRLWVAKTASPASDGTDASLLLSSVRGAIEALIEPGAPRPVDPYFIMPEVVSVEAEWTGFRANVSSDAKLPDISEKAKFDNLMAETSAPTTVLYFHGGAYYLFDPATHRSTTARLARLTSGRVYSVRYRLAPQNPFPAALVDALVSYLNLLYPQPDSFHDAVDPAHIVFAGDSAGGNLSLALLQLVMQLRRQSPDATIRWQGRDVPLPLPAGVAVNSPWLDLTTAFVSWDDGDAQVFDYLPPLSYQKSKVQPTCAAWPANPPRWNMYAPDAVLAHPLVSLVMAKSWSGAPPVWMCTGWEMLAHEDRWLARKLERDGVPVIFEQYEAMPHCFALVLGKIPEGVRCLESWAGFIKQVTGTSSGLGPGGDGGAAEHGIKTRFVTCKAKTLEEVPLEVEGPTDVSEEDVRDRVWKHVADVIPGAGREKMSKL